MPIYDYQCKRCKRAFDVFYRSIPAAEAEEKSEKCPHCGSVKKKRTVSKGTSFQLKGKGWYKDGY